MNNALVVSVICADKDELVPGRRYCAVLFDDSN